MHTWFTVSQDLGLRSLQEPIYWVYIDSNARSPKRFRSAVTASPERRYNQRRAIQRKPGQMSVHHYIL